MNNVNENDEISLRKKEKKEEFASKRCLYEISFKGPDNLKKLSLPVKFISS